MDKAFWKDTLERCIGTFAEAMLACITVGQALTEIDWIHALSISAVATIYTLLKQIGKHYGSVSYLDEDDDIEVLEDEPEEFDYDITDDGDEEEGEIDEY